MTAEDPLKSPLSTLTFNKKPREAGIVHLFVPFPLELPSHSQSRRSVSTLASVRTIASVILIGLREAEVPHSLTTIVPLFAI